ncbi:urea transporter [Colwellia psychrerythraea]|uniref:Urea transporter n=1 Tax=Colwellia psychrerythraea TaxID=28229 RepID=A0A099KJY4_COLPS|nr:urea transporter [Colwellia psychrerythraea]KGJ90701.1 Urea transporter [Colwellia psychrerythraea]
MTFPFEHFYKSFLRSCGQVMLQGNAITGLLFLLGIALNSTTMLLGITLAIISALAVAKLWQFDLTVVQDGLYGFNAALVGVAVFYFLPVSFFSTLMVIFGGAFSTVLMHFTLTRMARIPAFTTPFILSTWLILLFIEYTELTIIVSHSLDEGYFGGNNTATVIDYFQASMRGIGQVMLQGYWLSGLFFFCALFIHARKVAAWALFGSFTSLLIATGLNFPQEKIIMGLYGFNSCLVAIALSDRYPAKPWLITLAVLVSVLLTRLFELLTLPALTAPFVITTLLCIGLVNLKNFYDAKRSAKNLLF